MKYLLSLLTGLCLSVAAAAQSSELIWFDTKPVEFRDTSHKIGVKFVAFGDDLTIYYQMINRAGKILEEGNKVLPMQAIGVLSSNPIDTSIINPVIQQFNLTIYRRSED